MQNQSELTCVSCENTFDPAPHGGFCPDCDTPHPDFGRPDGGADDDGSENPGPDEADEADIQQAVENDGADPDEADADDEADDDDVAEVDDEADDDVAEADDEEADDLVEADDEEESDDDGAEIEADEVDAEDEADDESDQETVECGSCGTTVDPSVSFCPDCGADLDGEDDEPEELSACPDCGNEVSDESFCPDCGTDLDAVRQRLGDGEHATGVTLVVDGESFTFRDGDTFGRQEEGWLEALVRASGGREEVKYVSSDHLEFSVEDDGVYVTDVSTNGTLLNGEDLEGGEAKLEDGDELELAGRANIQVEL